MACLKTTPACICVWQHPLTTVVLMCQTASAHLLLNCIFSCRRKRTRVHANALTDAYMTRQETNAAHLHIHTLEKASNEVGCRLLYFNPLQSNLELGCQLCEQTFEIFIRSPGQGFTFSPVLWVWPYGGLERRVWMRLRVEAYGQGSSQMVEKPPHPSPTFGKNFQMFYLFCIVLI